MALDGDCCILFRIYIDHLYEYTNGNHHVPPSFDYIHNNTTNDHFPIERNKRRVFSTTSDPET